MLKKGAPGAFFRIAHQSDWGIVVKFLAYQRKKFSVFPQPNARTNSCYREEIVQT